LRGTGRVIDERKSLDCAIGTIIDRDADELDGFAARVRYFQDFAIMLGVEEVSPDQFQIDGL